MWLDGPPTPVPRRLACSAGQRYEGRRRLRTGFPGVSRRRGGIDAPAIHTLPSQSTPGWPPRATSSSAPGCCQWTITCSQQQTSSPESCRTIRCGTECRTQASMCWRSSSLNHQPQRTPSASMQASRSSCRRTSLGRRRAARGRRAARRTLGCRDRCRRHIRDWVSAEGTTAARRSQPGAREGGLCIRRVVDDAQG